MSYEDAVRNLNPGAQILRTEFSNVPLNLVLNTHRFDMKKVSNNAGTGCAASAKIEWWKRESTVYRVSFIDLPRHFIQLDSLRFSKAFAA